MLPANAMQLRKEQGRRGFWSCKCMVKTGNPESEFLNPGNTSDSDSDRVRRSNGHCARLSCRRSSNHRYAMLTALFPQYHRDLNVLSSHGDWVNSVGFDHVSLTSAMGHMPIGRRQPAIPKLLSCEKLPASRPEPESRLETRHCVRRQRTIIATQFDANRLTFKLLQIRVLRKQDSRLSTRLFKARKSLYSGPNCAKTDSRPIFSRVSPMAHHTITIL